MFGRKNRERFAATIGADGVQEATVRVAGGYSPREIAVEAGRPVRLTFLREDASSCSETLVSDDLGIRTTLPQGQPVEVAFTAGRPGAYAFGCDMGMITGAVVATAPDVEGSDR